MGCCFAPPPAAEPETRRILIQGAPPAQPLPGLRALLAVSPAANDADSPLGAVVLSAGEDPQQWLQQQQQVEEEEEHEADPPQQSDSREAEPNGAHEQPAPAPADEIPVVRKDSWAAQRRDSQGKVQEVLVAESSAEGNYANGQEDEI
eukprot:TRINITY_DN13159_c0_g1_i1.p1 TRINITY_DN13159_c0_g1~~TRINITY_DN13159_c0_g1_i1.p1  ORF type:complete len:174 (+),score=65.03 TRINITY_DN13159_c0_g1_i1:81-524(+)